MINIAVIEDCFDDFALLELTLKNFFTIKKESYRLTHFTNAVSFLENFASQFHLIFMDIDLPELNGMDAAREIRKKSTTVALVFLTNFSHYAICGYEVAALDYILKPIDEYSFFLKMPKVLRYVAHNFTNHITLINKNTIAKLKISEIYYLEVASHQLIYHTKSGKYETRGTMIDAEAELASYHFRRCNNCYLVNLAHISGIQGYNVQVGSDFLVISRPKKKYFINELTKYLGGTL